MKFPIIGRRGLTGALEIIVVFCMPVGAAMLVAMPWVLAWVVRGIGLHLLQNYQNLLVGLLEYADVLTLVIFWNLRKILKNINHKQPFIHENVRRIKIIALCCGLLYLGCFIYGLIIFSLYAIVVSIAFAFISLMLVVCAELFRAAIEFKEENDLTI